MKIETELYKQITAITSTDYEGMFCKEEYDEVLVTSESIIAMLEDLLMAVNSLKNEIKDIIADRDSNYRQLDISEQI